MPQKLNITPGPWRWQRVGPTFTVTAVAPRGSRYVGVHICTGCNAPGFEPQPDEALTNTAQLIAEAGTVAHETGLTPRQLAEQRQKLLAALAAAVARIELANAEGNPILSAWLPEARAVIAKARGEEG